MTTTQLHNHTTATLTDQIAEILNTPPCEAGMRLKSEVELAELLGAKPSQVRSVLTELESRDIVTRKRGSGTYLRKMPQAKATGCVNYYNGRKITASALLASTQNTSLNMKVLSSATKQFTVELWSCYRNTPFYIPTILEGITHELSRQGHRLSLHMLADNNGNKTYENKNLQTYLKQNPCDGYIVAAPWAEYFTQCSNKNDKPVIFFHPATIEKLNTQPIININTTEAIAWAINIFVDEGFSKIATFVLSGEEHCHKKDVNAYRSSISQAGLDYSQCILCPDDLDATIDKTVELMESADRPEAIYVADNYLIPGVSRGLKTVGLVPGEDVAVITHNNANSALPGNINWSCLEFNLEEYGRLLASELLRKIETPSVTLSSLAFSASWAPGDTHTLQ